MLALYRERTGLAIAHPGWRKELGEARHFDLLENVNASQVSAEHPIAVTAARGFGNQFLCARFSISSSH